ncbi:hypothetical protein PHPALM_28085 [Phytophthora palmivora]|uniref:WLGC domain-containing protein n=1 Tax=Phytophthora palmivora TaxID=4796 RepID=A0A2P4XAZ3_9STRA|nr:hypothetical protein PHPALM_28085 [Phytophthora palmivora]
MAWVTTLSTTKSWIRHHVERRIRPTHSSTIPSCETLQRRKWSRVIKHSRGQTQWHQSLIFFTALLVILAVCLGWTCWLLLLTVAPNEAINYIMQTKDLDNGSFWLLVEPTPSLRVLSVVGLSIVALGYCYIGAMLLDWGRQRILATTQNSPAVDHLQSALQEPKSSLRLEHVKTRHSTNSISSIHPVQSAPQQTKAHSKMKLSLRWPGLWCTDSETPKFAHIGMKVVDLMLQQFTLYQILEAGFPLPLVISCTVMVVWNALAVFALMFSPVAPSQIGEAVVDSIYCLATFDFDRATQKLMADLFPHWSFQNAARLHANPEQTTKIFKSLQGLRFQSVGVWIARMGNNFGLLISLRRLMRLLRSQVPQNVARNPNSKVRNNIYPRKHSLAWVLVAIALFTILFVAVSVIRSQKACESFPKCTIHAYRWWLSTKSDSDGSGSSNVDWNCPCRVLIDVDLFPTNVSVWKNPPDATAVVSNLAASGDLEILQIINRRLEHLPHALLGCSQLKHIALIYTHTITLPLWAAEFTNLEFLHIQGKERDSSLVSLPQGLFVNMKKLTFVHLGAHVGLQQLPNVAGLTNLRSITMARMALEALPADFAQLEHLEIIIVLMMPGLKSFPDLSRARDALKMLLIDPCPLCCNGFLQNGCDLTRTTCGNRDFGENEQLSCLPPGLLATSGAQYIFQSFNSTICVNQAGSPPLDSTTNQTRPDSPNPNIPGPPPPKEPSESEVDANFEQNVLACGGIAFRECKLTPTGSGICNSDRFMPVACIGDPNIIELRRQQIKRNIGPRCNPEYEAWLGCTLK